MKFLNSINSSAKKFVKGITIIFVIKVLLFGGSCVIQSCQTDSEEVFENSEQELAISKFENLVRNQTPEITKIIVKHQQLATEKTVNSNDINAQTVKEAKEIMMPIVDGTKELLQLYGINESDFAEEFNDTNDPRIAFV